MAGYAAGGYTAAMNSFRAALALLLPCVALHAAAEDAPGRPLAMKILHAFASEGVIDPGFTVLATPTKSSVNLWSLDTGRQVGRIELPAIESRHDNDYHELMIHSVRPDLKALLVSVRHLFYDPKYVYGGGMPNMARGVQRLYLASTEDETKLKLLWTFEGPCSYGGGIVSYHCPGTADYGGETRILDDYPQVITRAALYAGKKSIVDLAFDLNGKKLFENKFLDADWDRAKKDYVPAAPEPPFSIVADDQSCSVMRGSKRVSFLEGCVKNDQPELSPDRKKALTRWGPIYKAWNVETGALTGRIEPHIPEGWSTGFSALGIWTQSADGRLVSVLLKKEHESQVHIWNTDSGRKLAVGSGPDWADAQSFVLSPDGRRGLYVKHQRAANGDLESTATVVVDLGLEDAPAAAPSAPALAKLDVDTLPSGSSALNPDAFAVVIGVEKYRQAGVPAVDYASRDAKTMAAYLGTMGFDPKNVAVLTDAQAGKVDFDKHFGKWLKNRVGPKSRVFVYYAGHGAPNPTTGAGYLMPYEADPSYLDETAYPVAQLYAELGKLPTKDVTVVLDACFSGQGERSLIAKGTRPLVAVQKTAGPENAAVIAAASGSQISASDHEARHGLLTYHLLAGLHGGADEDQDGRITTSELFAYARPAVERAAKLQNVEQTPTVSGDAGAAGARVWTVLKKP